VIGDMLPPDLTSLVEEDEELLIQYRCGIQWRLGGLQRIARAKAHCLPNKMRRILQVHAAVAMWLGYCDTETIYHVRVALVSNSTRRPTQHPNMLGNRCVIAVTAAACETRDRYCMLRGTVRHRQDPH
jgi:hypothetical protein